MASYLRHPLLKNPVKWLRGVKKRHNAELAVETPLTQRLQSDPFAASLTSTRRDVSYNLFPIGNMIQVIVGDKNEKGHYPLQPVIEKPSKGQHPASYVINYKKYLEILEMRRFLPTPMKYRMRGSIEHAIKKPENFIGEVEELYRGRITELLSSRSGAAENNRELGFLLTPGERKASVSWSELGPVIATDLVAEETFVAFEESELAMLLWKLVAFHQ